MILDTIKTDTIFEVTAKNLANEKIPQGHLGFLKYEESYFIFLENKRYDIEIIDKNRLDEIDYFFLNRNYTAIVNIIESIRETLFTMEIIFFTFPIQEIFVPFYVSLDEKVLATSKRAQVIKYNDTVDTLGNILKEKIVFEINGNRYFLVSTATSSQDEAFEEEFTNIGQNLKKIDKSDKIDDIDKKKYIEENKIELQGIESRKKKLAFSIHGENILLPVEKHIKQNGDFRFNTTKLVFKATQKKDSLRIIQGNIEFKNGLVREKIANVLEDIIESEGSYLNTWDKYIDEEGKILIEKAKKIGELKIDKFTKTDTGYQLKIENFDKVAEVLTKDDFLSFTDTIPNYITDDLSWTEFIAQKEQEDNLNIKKQSSEFFEIQRISNGFITIKTDKNMKNYKTKKIVLSIYGDEIQLVRKLDARKRLRAGKSANPLLGLLVEDTDDYKKFLKTTNTKKLESLTQNIKDKIFSTNPPTQNQIDAIGIALNTPDFAIIQGPPGTGKTTVLTAIIERLNEESNKENMKGQVLIAGFQHDAVENIIQRLDINGIPTLKFGKKSKSIVDISSYEKVMEWSESIVTAVKHTLPELSNHIKISKLNNYFKTYLKTPSKSLAIELLNYINYELAIFIDKELLSEVNTLLKGFTKTEVENNDDFKKIYALRTTDIGFKDDGKERNLDLLCSNVGKVLNDDEREFLQNITTDNLEEYIRRLTKLKFTLIDRLYPKPQFKAEKPNEEIVALKDKVEKVLSYGTSTKDKKNIILANYVNELESNPFGLTSMIEEYNYVYSSTTGQSYKALKQKSGDCFDTLIIDEAARVPPMDLLVTMVLAKRRIILVGDHRQLPHMVDEKVIQSSGLDENEFIKESMFGYLKKRCKELEEFDKNRRTITLENQYRTHPTLGEFVSSNFYKKYNEGFKSPLGRKIGTVDDFFYQNLSDIERTPAVWIDVPNSQCHEFGGMGWSRTCEAEKIMEHLRKWILSDEGKHLSFGIISFYRKQVSILEELLNKEFTEDEIDSFHNRLKIGTVDSFQGMEFDIVFLSVVRSTDINKINNIIEGYKLFGFLLSKNRLCVSMSRQKKCLIVVGDKEFFETRRAQKDVGELHNFLQLCKNEGKILL